MEFARQCIVIPEGRHTGSLWRPAFQPFAYWLLHLMDTLGFRRFAVTGCVQSGKTLMALVVNVCWHLFEMKQSVIFVVPELTMASKKYKEEIEPVINASRWLRRVAYGSSKRTTAPSGAGSKGGFGNVIRFANGTRLEFMGATGTDARRSSSTAQVLFKTEVDRYDEAAASSREASAAITTEDRTESYDDDAYIYEECTMTVVNGRINKQYHLGTATELYGPCPHCRRYVLPKREHLVGIEDCETISEARRQGCFVCPNCEEILSQAERDLMQERSYPLHRGQKVKLGSDGYALMEGEFPVVEGPLPDTDVMSFRWNAFQNRFWVTRSLAGKEWKSLYSDTPDDEDKQSTQKRWAEPAVSEQFDITTLTMRMLINAVTPEQSRVVPTGSNWLTNALDLGGSFIHFVARSWQHENEKLTGHMIDMGRMKVDVDRYGLEDALLTALRKYRDERLLPGYFDANGEKHVAGWTLIDAGWKERIVWRFVLECVQMGIYTIVPILGRGQSDPSKAGTYRHPEQIDNKKVFWIGDECHLRKSSRYEQVFIDAGCPHPPLYVMCNSDELKSYVREGYQAPRGANGALTTFKATTEEEREALQQYRKETLAEKEIRKYIDGRGSVSLWRNTHRQKNHYGDCDYYNVPAAQLCGAPVTVRRRITTTKPAEPEADKKPLTMPDGRPFMQVERN